MLLPESIVYAHQVICLSSKGISDRSTILALFTQEVVWLYKCLNHSPGDTDSKYIYGFVGQN